MIAITARPEDAPLEARLHPNLLPHLAGATDDPIVWPPLSLRGEDLHALVIAGLAREGIRRKGTPLGIEDAAYEKLADYAYPGEDAELRAILRRLAQTAEGEVVRAKDLVWLDRETRAEPT